MSKMTIRNVPVINAGYTPYMPTGFGQMYRGPVFDAEGGSGNGGGDDSAAAKKAAADAEKARKEAEDKLNQLTDKEAKLLKEVMDRKNAAKEAQNELDRLKQQYEGVDPEEFKRLRDEKKKADEESLKKQGDFETLKSRMAEEHNKELEKERKNTKAVQDKVNALANNIRTLTVGSAFSSSKFLNEDTVLPPAIAKVAYDAYFDVDDNGNVVGYDAPRGATNRVAMVGGNGQPLGFDDVLKRIVDASPDKDKVLKTNRKPGMGGGTVDLPGREQNPNPNNGAYMPGQGLSKIAKNLGNLGLGKKS